MEKVAAANTESAAPASSPSAPAADNERALLSGLPAQAIGHIGDTPDPKLSHATMERATAIQPDFEAALADSVKHGEQPADGETDVVPAMAERSSEVPIPGQTATQDTREPTGLKRDVGNSEHATTATKSEGTSTAEQPDDSIVSKIGQSVNNAVNYVSETVSDTVQGTTTSEPQESQHKPQMTDTSVQTGQQDITIRSPTGTEENLTLHLGGRAPQEGNVVVKDGQEIVGDMDERHRTATTGHGM